MSDELDSELEELREQTTRDNRLSEQANEPDFIEQIVAMLDDVDSGERGKILSLYDPQLAALIYALETDDRRFNEVIGALQETANRQIDTEDVGRTELLKLAVRIGLQEAAPELLEDAQTAVSQRTEF
jgi:nitrate reductase assembly molybdenum cofactor insertion protein NarJ